MVLAGATVVGMGATGGAGYFAGSITGDRRRRSIVPVLAAQLNAGAGNGDFSAVGGALSTARRHGVLHEVVSAMAPGSAFAEEQPNAGVLAKNKETEGRFHLKNLRSAVDMRKPSAVYAALADARRAQALESMVDQLGMVLAQGGARQR